MPKYYYRYYGLSIASEIALPELQTDDATAPPDLSIRLGKIPDKLDAAQVTHKVRCAIARGHFLQKVQGVADYYAHNGREIIITPAAKADMAALRLFLLTSAMAAILYQRGYLLLQACVVEKNGEAFLVAGESGLGKSATVAGLLPYGYRLVSDDICCIETIQNKYYVHSGAPVLKLWPDIFAELSHHPIYQTADVKTIRNGCDKLQVKLCRKTFYAGNPIPIKGIYLLRKHIPAGISELNGFAALHSLKRVAYRQGILSAQQAEQAFFEFATRISMMENSIRMLPISRDISIYQEFIEQLQQELAGGCDG